MKISVLNPQITRQRLANPFIDMPYKERLIQAKATDLTNNHTFKMLDNGYAQIKPIDANKLVI